MKFLGGKKKDEKSTLGAEILLFPEPSAPMCPMDSLMRDILHRVVERDGPITLDITNMIRPEINPRPVGNIRWEYGAWVGDELIRNSKEPVPFEKIDKFEVTFWFEEAGQNGSV